MAFGETNNLLLSNNDFKVIIGVTPFFIFFSDRLSGYILIKGNFIPNKSRL
jgi:hypothetical protein